MEKQFIRDIRALLHKTARRIKAYTNIEQDGARWEAAYMAAMRVQNLLRTFEAIQEAEKKTGRGKTEIH